jgi:hypothetical protein
MVWGLVRIGILSIAFVVGLMVIGPLGSSASWKTFHIPRLNEHMGESLVVACESGNVVLKHIGGKPGAVQLECSQSKMKVVRDHREQETHYYHLLHL